VGRGYFLNLKNHNTKSIGDIDLIIFSVYRSTFKVLFYLVLKTTSRRWPPFSSMH